VTVTLAATKTGVNAALAAAGAISGTVTQAGTQNGLKDVHVDVFGSGYYETTTAADGSYALRGLKAGANYRVCFYSDYYSYFSGSGRATGGSSDVLGYVDQCYDTQPTGETSTPVTVALGAATTINTALIGAGAISGKVTEAGGNQHSLGDVYVTVSTPSGAERYATTALDGSYTVTGLAAGNDYKVCFEAPSASGGSSDALGYANQCYDNQPLGTPTPVTVARGETKTGINAALAAGGAISGTVTEVAGGQVGLEYVVVSVSSASTGATGWAYTTADGSYTVIGLRAATDYRVCFDAERVYNGTAGPLGYANQCYDNQPTSDESTPVIVTAGQTRTGTNAALVEVRAGTISGTVTQSGTQHGLEGVAVQVSSQSTNGWGYATTDVDGNYTVSGLPPGGDYTVCFESYGGYLGQCYDNQPSSGTPTPVTVTGDQTKTGINAALVPTGESITAG
jgi:hypothetical protein